MNKIISVLTKCLARVTSKATEQSTKFPTPTYILIQIIQCITIFNNKSGTRFFTRHVPCTYSRVPQLITGRLVRQETIGYMIQR